MVQLKENLMDPLLGIERAVTSVAGRKILE
jgi:hypothetical protein